VLLRSWLPGWRRWLPWALSVWTARSVWLGYNYALGAGGVRRRHVESALLILVALGVVWCLARLGGAGGSVEAHARPPRRLSGHGLLCLPMALAAAGLVFWRAVPVGLLSDDFVLLSRALAGDLLPAGAAPFVRPLPLFAWAQLARTGLETAIVLHVLNIVLHAVNTWLVWLIAGALGMTRATAVLAAALFLTYPACLEAVAWCSGIHDVLVTTAVLCCVVLCVRPLRPGIHWPLLAASMAVGLLTKETAVAMPFLGLLAVIAAEPRARAARASVLAAVLIVFGYLAARFVLLELPAAYAKEASRYLLKELAMRPFAVLGAPWSDRLLAERPWLMLLSIGGISVLFFSACRSWARDSRAFRTAACLALWVLAAIAPTYAFFFVGGDLQGSRYTYLAEAGWAMLVASMLWPSSPAPGWRLAARAALALAMVGLSVGALRFHMRSWLDAAALRDQVLRSAADALRDGSCAPEDFLELPDSIDGAYVFRNGFREALFLERGVAAVPGPRPDSTCALRWRGDRFEKVSFDMSNGLSGMVQESTLPADPSAQRSSAFVALPDGPTDR